MHLQINIPLKTTTASALECTSECIFPLHVIHSIRGYMNRCASTIYKSKNTHCGQDHVVGNQKLVQNWRGRSPIPRLNPVVTVILWRGLGWDPWLHNNIHAEVGSEPRSPWSKSNTFFSVKHWFSWEPRHFLAICTRDTDLQDILMCRSKRVLIKPGSVSPKADQLQPLKAIFTIPLN